MHRSRRSCIAFAFAALTLLAAACSGGSKHPGTPAASPPAGTAAAPHPTATVDARTRPPGVPASAQIERADREFGAPSVPAGTDPNTVPAFKGTSCADDVLTIETTTLNVYADLPCDRALPQVNAQTFVGKPVHVRFVVADPSKLYFDSASAGSVEFTVGRIWTAAP